MKKDFYTMGGGHFWEDIFFYQKWRIQRNTVSKVCRLLDNWDIRRYEGSFEDCRKAFVKYIEAYEISRQKGHMIVMIHSLGDSKNIFKPLWREALKNNFLAAAVNYPSTEKGLAAHVKQFNFFLDHLEDVEEISFVTKGNGNLILQKLLESDSDWKKRLKLNRVVEVAPCLFGDNLTYKLSMNNISGFFIGPMGEDLDPRIVKNIPQITKAPLGIVLTNKGIVTRILEKITKTQMKNKSIDEIKNISNAKDIIEIKDHHVNCFSNKQICKEIMNFLIKGKFYK